MVGRTKKDRQAREAALLQSVRRSFAAAQSAEGSSETAPLDHATAPQDGPPPPPPSPPAQPAAPPAPPQETGSTPPSGTRQWRVLGDARVRSQQVADGVAESSGAEQPRKRRGIAKASKAVDFVQKTGQKIRLSWDPLVKGPSSKEVNTWAVAMIGTAVRNHVAMVAPSLDECPESERWKIFNALSVSKVDSYCTLCLECAYFVTNFAISLSFVALLRVRWGRCGNPEMDCPGSDRTIPAVEEYTLPLVHGSRGRRYAIEFRRPRE